MARFLTLNLSAYHKSNELIDLIFEYLQEVRQTLKIVFTHREINSNPKITTKKGLETELYGFGTTQSLFTWACIHY